MSDSQNIFYKITLNVNLKLFKFNIWQKKLISTIAIIFIIASTSFAQSVAVKPKKVIYTKDDIIDEDPIIDKGDHGDAAARDWDAVTVIYPRISGIDSLLAQNLEASIDSYYLQDSLGGKPLSYAELVAKKGQGLHDYKVNYNDNGLLDITFHWKLILGHLYEEFYTIIFDVNNGTRIMPQSVFIKTSGLVDKIRKAQKLDAKQAIAEMKKNHNAYSMCSFLKREFHEKFSARNLTNFSISDKGITFVYNYNREHICAEMYPKGRYFFTWKEIKTFIKPTGLLGNFIPPPPPVIIVQQRN